MTAAPPARLWDERPGTATISDDGRYRYDLTRQWAESGPWVLWVMLNPSTADAHIDDPTIRRCRGFARSWDLAGMAVVNLYAYRAASPSGLTMARDPRGPNNALHVQRWLRDPQVVIVVAAWGAGAAKVLAPRLNIRAMAADAGHELWCLGTTPRTGFPRHPLFVRSTQALERLYPEDGP